MLNFINYSRIFSSYTNNNNINISHFFVILSDTEIPIIKQSTSPGPHLHNLPPHHHAQQAAHQQQQHQQHQQQQQQQQSPLTSQHSNPNQPTFTGSTTVINIKTEQNVLTSPTQHQQHGGVNLQQHSNLTGPTSNNNLQSLNIPHRPLLHNLLSGGSLHSTHHRSYGAGTTGNATSLNESDSNPL